MLGITREDRLFSTIGGRFAAVFNTDGRPRTEIVPSEARKALDFDIIKKQNFDETGRRIPGQFHLVRSDTNSIIPTGGIGKKFVPVQHYKIFDYVVDDILPQLPDYRLETVGTLHGGGTGVISALGGERFTVDGDTSSYVTRLIFCNPCNGSGRFSMGLSIVRESSQSQFLVAKSNGVGKDAIGFAVKHTRNASFFKENTLSSISSFTPLVISSRESIDRLASLPMDETMIDKMLDAVFPIKHPKGSPGYTRTCNNRMEVQTQLQMGEIAMTMPKNSAWKLLNAFVYPIFNPARMGSRKDYGELFIQGGLGPQATRVLSIKAEIEAMLS